MLSNNNLHKLQNKQSKMDTLIFMLHKTDRKKTLPNRELSFLIELSELMNEHRGFKYWSHRGPSPKEVMLEEYADALHFLLSISIDVGVNFGKDPFNYQKSLAADNITAFTLNLCDNFTTFKREPSLQNFHQVMLGFLSLGKAFGFSEIEIIEAYEKKYRMNYHRQANNY